MPIGVQRRLDLVAAFWFAAAAIIYLIYSIATILRWAPHALYADQWRQYFYYLNLPFPANILRPDNGHRLIVPNLIAWLELRWVEGNQWLQIAIGVASMLSAALIVATICARDLSVPIARRSAAAFLAVMAMFWLANARTLVHSTELLHTSIPILCLALALVASINTARFAVPAVGALTSIGCAMIAAVVATFSFGYGIAVFVAILAVLAARKGHWRQFVTTIAGLVLTAALYFGMTGSDSVQSSLKIAPAENALIAVRWLGAPFVTLFNYLWNPGSSGLLPTHLLQNGAYQIATFVGPKLPDLRISTFPQAVFGALGVCSLLWISTRRLQTREQAGPTEAAGLGIAWFGFAAAGIVSISRLQSFHIYPSEVYAERYLPWPCLFWMGLALATLGRTRRGWLAGSVLAFTTLLPLLAWPTHYGGRVYAGLMRGLVDNIAAGSEVGVIGQGTSIGETRVEDINKGLSTFRAKGVAQFSTRGFRLQGQTLPADLQVIEGAGITLTRIDDNLIGPPGSAVSLRLPQQQHAPHQLLLVDKKNTVVGLVNRDARLTVGYSGYVRCVDCVDELRAVAHPE